MKSFINWCVQRLTERSTWLGLISLICSLGVVLNPEVQESIVTTGVSIGALIAILTSDKKSSKLEK